MARTTIQIDAVAAAKLLAALDKNGIGYWFDCYEVDDPCVVIRLAGDGGEVVPMGLRLHLNGTWDAALAVDTGGDV